MATPPDEPIDGLGREAVQTPLARCFFPPRGSSVDLAVSGGPDSMALMVLARAAGLVAEVHHVDHGIRDNSQLDRIVVGQLAERLGYGVTVYELRIEAGPDLERRARDARRAVLPAGTLTGHTADDQAETVLLALGRGSGLWGLGAMSPHAGHPLLAVRRSETHRLVAELGISTVDDPTNESSRFRRNRVRHELIPEFEATFERDVVPVLARTAENLRELAEWLDLLASDIDAADARAISAAPRPVAIAALRAWWRAETGLNPVPDGAAMNRILGVARGESARQDVVEGWYVRRTGGRLYLRRHAVPGSPGAGSG